MHTCFLISFNDISLNSELCSINNDNLINNMM